MGSVFKKPFTKLMPKDAELVEKDGELVAFWKGRGGKKRSGTVITGNDGSQRVSILSSTYSAKYRNGQGDEVVVSTGCKDKSAALIKLAELEQRAERVRSGVISPGDDRLNDHHFTPITKHIEEYLVHHQACETSEHHIKNVKGCLDRLVRELKIERLADLNATKLERWLLDAKAKISGRTRNRYLSAISAFCNWCLFDGRLSENPFSRVAKANEKVDKRRPRRAMTEAELRRVLEIARRRPLEDALLIRRGERKGQLAAKVSPTRRDELERLGRERALLYKTLVLTGLRKGELASITIGQVHLEANPPYIELEAADEKNREGAYIPLRSDLADELRSWIADYENASANQPLFNVPSGLIRIFDRDLEAAGIPKVDERGRTLDVHALRTTFGTMLSVAGVQPRTAQQAMRHSDIDLTMNVYTDPKMLDVAGAVELLPALPLNSNQDQGNPNSLALTLALNSVSECENSSPSDNLDTFKADGEETEDLDVTACSVNEKSRLSSSDKRLDKKRAKGFEPSTFSLGS